MNYNQWQKLWEKLLFGQFCVSTPFLLLTRLKNNEQKLHQAMLWVCIIIEGEKGNFKHTFKISIMFCQWLSEIYKKKRKMRFYACSFRKLKWVLMNLIMLCYALSLTTWQLTVPKWLTKYSNNVFVIWHLLENWKCCSLVKLLCIYFCFFILLNHG